MKRREEWLESLFPEVAHCYISISKTITRTEWEEIYKELLPLVQKLDFCYTDTFNYEGVTGQCLVRSKEVLDNTLGFTIPKLKIEGLYTQRLAVGPVYIDTYLRDNWCEQETGSAFLGYAYDDHSLAITMLQDELQDPSYIIRIMALAFYIESRLPEKIFVHGSFSDEYVSEALDIINEYLKQPIGLPLICRARDLLMQTLQTNFTTEERLKLFFKTYKGKYDDEFWNLMNDNFGKKTIDSYIKRHKKDFVITKHDKKENISDEKTTEAERDNAEEQYDIEWSSELFSYKTGDTIKPQLLNNVITVLKNTEPAKEQKGYKGLCENQPLDQIRKLAAFKKDLALTDEDWKHIVHYFKTTKNAIERYYPLFMVCCDSYSATSNIVRSLMTNDDLYNYCSTMEEC